MTETPRITLEPAVDSDDFDATRSLFRDYQKALGIDLEFQGFGAELATMPWHYAEPAGRILLARVDGEIAGCIALRPIENELRGSQVSLATRGLRLLPIGRPVSEEGDPHARESRSCPCSGCLDSLLP